jgi:flagellar biosynthesis/type III secretory pathway protein FliH
MNWLKWVLVSLAIVLVVGAGGFVLYYVAYAMGGTEGYGRGYSTGQEVGYSSGEEDGYASGQQAGYIEGYDIGYDDGRDLGYDEGYDDGMEAGFGHGYTLRDPTYKEAVAFIEEDKTSDNEYNDDDYGVYVCSHFSRDVCNNA